MFFVEGNGVPRLLFKTSRFVTTASLALAVSFSASADFTGKVVGVADGDSITVLR